MLSVYNAQWNRRRSLIFIGQITITTLQQFLVYYFKVYAKHILKSEYKTVSCPPNWPSCIPVNMATQNNILSSPHLTLQCSKDRLNCLKNINYAGVSREKFVPNSTFLTLRKLNFPKQKCYGGSSHETHTYCNCSEWE
jgi:hypothetical protein